MHLIHVTTLFSLGGTPHEMKYEVIFLFKKTQGNELSVGEKCYFHSKHLNFLINEKKEKKKKKKPNTRTECNVYFIRKVK